MNKLIEETPEYYAVSFIENWMEDCDNEALTNALEVFFRKQAKQVRTQTIEECAKVCDNTIIKGASLHPIDQHENLVKERCSKAIRNLSRDKGV